MSALQQPRQDDRRFFGSSEILSDRMQNSLSQQKRSSRKALIRDGRIPCPEDADGDIGIIAFASLTAVWAA